ncbi:hypothetical protein GCM10010271_67850 [Streptomyces kurssanovii]|nr:hypothetical protein GCM10010271_67850 [Streptomyces kurssanovii]
MGRPPALPVDMKMSVVLKVISGDETASAAAERVGVSVQAVSKWKHRFLEAGRLGLASEVVSRDSAREAEMAQEIHALKQALGELYLETQHLRRRVRPPGGMPAGKSSTN